MLDTTSTPIKEVRKTLGSCNCILVVPDGYPYESTNPLTLFSHSVLESLNSYGIVNTKYKNSITNLSNTEHIRKNKRITKEYIHPIVQYKDEIQGNNQTPLLIILQSISDNQLSENGLTTTDLVIGIGQGERRSKTHPHKPTFAPSIVTRLRLALTDNGFSTALAPSTSNLCGHEPTSLNQLFSQKNFFEDLYDPNVSSLVMSIREATLRNPQENIHQMGIAFAQAIGSFTEKMPLVRNVRRETIETNDKTDRNYIFRVQDKEENYVSLLREEYIDELAHSIQKSGLIHPLVLLQKDDGKYKILCGYRRFQALTKLGTEWVEAKIYQESDFSTEDFFDISLAENTKRRNLNPVEIGNFLESAAQELGMNNADLAEKFGQTLGIGKPNQNVSQSTIHKYRKINGIRLTGMSKDIINDIVNEKLQFTIAAELLAPIKDPDDRNRFYLDVIKTLSSTRSQAIQIKKLLEANGKQLKETLRDKTIRDAIEKALLSEHKSSAFIKYLQKKHRQFKKPKQLQFQKKVEHLRKSLFKDAQKNDFKISQPSKGRRKEITLQLKIRPDTLKATIEGLKQLADHSHQLSELFTEAKK